MARKFTIQFILYAVLFVFASSCAMAAPETFSKNVRRYQLKLEEADRCEESGSTDEAVTLSLDAMEILPDRADAGLNAIRLYLKAGKSDLAEKLFPDIPLKNLNNDQLASFYLYQAKCFIAGDKRNTINKERLQKAFDVLEQSIKAKPENPSSHIYASAISLVLGNKNKSVDFLRRFRTIPNNAEPRSILLAYLLDMDSGNLSRAADSAEKFAASISETKASSAFYASILKKPWAIFVLFAPVCLDVKFCAAYFFVLALIIGIVVTKVSNGKISHCLLFALIVAAVHSLLKYACFDIVLTGICQKAFGSNNNIWVIPKLLVASHIALYCIFIYQILTQFIKKDFRPKDTELYGTWFFSLFFMVFVCSFQSDISGKMRFILLTSGLFFSIISSVFLPLGKFFMYRATKLLGFSNINEMLNTAEEENDEDLSFTEAQIIQSNSEKMLQNEEFENVISKSKYVSRFYGKYTLPQLWLNEIIAYIYLEDYASATSSISEFLGRFEGTAPYDEGLLFQAVIKYQMGEFPTALKLIKSLNEINVKSFTKNERAFCLLVIGGCGRFFKDYVQSHIDLTKAIELADYPFLKAEAILEAADLDYAMKAKDGLKKWLSDVEQLKGEKSLTRGFCKTVSAIQRDSEGKHCEALNMMKSAMNYGRKNDKISYWYGHILCLLNRYKEAESIAEQMVLGTYSRDRLIAEVTDTKL